MDAKEINHEVNCPLDNLVREREEKKRSWEDNNCRIRPFYPFSLGIGERRALSDEDKLFLTYALENNVTPSEKRRSLVSATPTSVTRS